MDYVSFERGSIKIGMSIPATTKSEIIGILNTHQDAFVWEEEAPFQVDQKLV